MEKIIYQNDEYRYFSLKKANFGENPKIPFLMFF